MMTDIRCRKCGRFLGSFHQMQMVITLKCPNCKSLERYHYVDLSQYVPPSGIMKTSAQAHRKDAPRKHKILVKDTKL